MPVITFYVCVNCLAHVNDLTNTPLHLVICPVDGGGPSGPLGHPLAPLPLHELLTQLSPPEVSFFTMLDAQLDKVESFYVAREKEMIARGQLLQIQLLELSDHRKMFKACPALFFF